MSVWWDANGGCSGWFQISGGVASNGSPVTSSVRNPNHLDLFTTASDGRIMSTWWDAASGWAQGWLQISGGVAAAGSTVTAVARSSSTVQVTTTASARGSGSAGPGLGPRGAGVGLRPAGKARGRHPGWLRRRVPGSHGIGGAPRQEVPGDLLALPTLGHRVDARRRGPDARVVTAWQRWRRRTPEEGSSRRRGDHGSRRRRRR